MSGPASGPRLEPAALEILAEHVGSSAAESFLATYLTMLPDRLERIVRALEVRDTDQALDAVISLKVTSAMAGARDLERECARVLRSLEDQPGWVPAPRGILQAAFSAAE